MTNIKKEIENLCENYIKNEGKELFDNKNFKQLSKNLSEEICKKFKLPSMSKKLLQNSFENVFIKNYGEK